MKITDYGTLAATAVQADDVLPVVDVHDFTQAGTGSTKKVTAGALLASASDSVNAVLKYGADPTGAADATTAIQNALTAAGAGHAAYLPGGTYKISAPLTIPDQTGLLAAVRSFGIPSGSYGNGSLPLTGAILKPSSTFSGAEVLFMDGVTGGGQHGGQVISGITIDGSSLPAANTVNGIAVSQYVAAVTLRDVMVYGGYAGSTGLGGNGLDFEGTSGHNPDFFDSYGVKVSACKGAGIKLSGLADSVWVACEATGNNGDNWNITNGSNSRYVACKGESSGAGWDFNIIGFSGFTGYAEWIGLSGGGGFSGAIQVSGTGTGTFYFAATHLVSGAVTISGTNTVKTTPAWTSGSIVSS